MLLQDTVRRQATERPGATAIVSHTRRIGYRQLDEWSNRIARLLLIAGSRPGDRIGLLVPKSIEAIAGMLGILKAGGIYVPMDTRSPLARLRKIVDSCQPCCILAAGEPALLHRLCQDPSLATPFSIGWLEPGIPPPDLPRVAFSWSDMETLSAAPLQHFVSENDPAHILFTSGSTGTPKGVTITHANVNSFLNWATEYFEIGPEDRISSHPPLHFDLSTFDIFGTFLAGAELHLVPSEASLLPHKLAEFIRTAGLTQWFSVPSALKFMAQFGSVQPGDFPALKRIMWCGEALPTPTLIYWMRRLPHVRFTNLYGPTETTIASSYHTVPCCPESDNELVPIGVACPGEQLAVLDESLQPVRDGEIGDLYISGEGLSPGYWNDPEKTAAVFLTNPDGVRVYKTGDLAQAGTDGLFYLLGRADSQIKSRGYRIELGEVEAALNTLEEVQECGVVALPTNDFDGTAICCAYVAANGLDPQPPALREKLRALLPSYMLPSRWMCLRSLPLNSNGKIDRPRLREQFGTYTVSA